MSVAPHFTINSKLVKDLAKYSYDPTALPRFHPNPPDKCRRSRMPRHFPLPGRIFRL
ncbi:hypothetical protein CLOSTASPAR_00451 [[Clostridium] asparagiforme DSM 15981]|uniref:Uncharacterized protein n=1 Tax=[Clostridium] asparagiforme DSM 15981 TaxID=518636 RepID=C0CU01_9FIRM|nr:hypothetical protein CLOSTASPAR_00451 [[Clostridium] asparagiforme DSM 15981]